MKNENEELDEVVEDIATTLIDRVDQPRTKSWGDIEGLAQSILIGGQTTPAIVRTSLVEGRYELVSGERRFRACEKLGRPLRAIVRDMSDATAQAERITENIQRQDLSPLEEGEAFGVAINEHGRSIEELAARIGRRPHYVKQRLALLDLVEQLRGWLEKDILCHDGALALAQEPIAVQRMAVDSFRDTAAKGLRIERGDVADFLRGHTNELARAPFDPASATLVPGVGACTECPKRSINDVQGRLFAVVEDDVCLDAKCWEAKVDAQWIVTSEGAKKLGLRVLDAKKSEKAFAYESELVQLDKPAYYLDAKGKPTSRNGEWNPKTDVYVEHAAVSYRELLGPDAKVVVARHPQTGVAVQLGDKAIAAQALARILPKETTVSTHQRAKPSTAKEKEAAKAARLKDAAHEKGLDDAIAKLVADTEADPTSGDVFRAFAFGVLGVVHSETLRAVCKRRGWSLEDASSGEVLTPKETCVRETRDMQIPVISALLIEVIATASRADFEHGLKGTALELMLKARKIDVAHYRREAERELSGGVAPKKRTKGAKTTEAADAAE